MLPHWYDSQHGEAVSKAVIINLSKVEPTIVRWVDPGRIPLGTLTILDGDPGLGKTTVALDYAARLTRGARMPMRGKGDLWGQPCGVVLLSAEDDPAATIRPKLDAMRADIERIVMLQGVVDDEEEVARGVHMGDLESLRKAVKRVEAKLVIIDPLMAYFPARANAHRDQDVRAIFSPLIQMANELDVAVLVIRHLSKLSGEAHSVSALYRGGGSIGIAGAARSVLLVAPDPGDETGERRVLVRVKGNLSKPPAGLMFRLKDTEDGPAVIQWEGEVSEDPNELLAAPTPDMEPSKIAEASQWLAGRLKSDPQSARELIRAAAKDGITERSLLRARKKIGARTKKGDGPKESWMWFLPKPVEPITPIATVSHWEGI